MVLNELKEGQVALIGYKQPLKMRVIENVGKKVKVALVENPERIYPREWWENGGMEILKVY